MDPQFLHLEDPLTWEFDAQIVSSLTLPDGRPAVVLDRTYFYPTGGGQEHDTGRLGAAAVLEVLKDEQHHAVLHVLDQSLPPGPVHASIDALRRLRNMQHHTAQHRLSQCLLHLLHIESLSTNINAFTASTLDIGAAHLSQKDIESVEDLANQIIYEDRPVKFYFVTPEQLKELPLRWPPAVNENIRIVEIDAFDYTPCGGTHCTRTGTIGMLKILKAERQGENTRLSFVAGGLALETFRSYQSITTGLANQLSVHPNDLPAAIQRQIEQLKLNQQELQGFRQEALEREAQSLASGAEQIGQVRVVTAIFENRPVEELRSLANHLKLMPFTAGLLLSQAEGQYSVIVTCSEDSGLDARQLLAGALSQAGGRGGGNPRLAQGGGAGREQTVRALFDRLLLDLRNAIR